MRSCLVVDEHSVVRKISWRILSQMGYDADTAETIEEAEASLASGKAPHIVIVSATLPDCPVEEAIQRLRAHPNGRHSIILASLVQANLGLMTRSKRAGAAGFVYRPFDRRCLEEWLQPFGEAAAL